MGTLKLFNILDTITPNDDARANFFRKSLATDRNAISKPYGIVRGFGDQFRPSTSGKKCTMLKGMLYAFGRLIENDGEAVVYDCSSSVLSVKIACYLVIDLSDQTDQKAFFAVYTTPTEGTFHREDDGNNLFAHMGGIAKILVGRWIYSNGIVSVYDTPMPFFDFGIADSVHGFSFKGKINGVPSMDVFPIGRARFANHAETADVFVPSEDGFVLVEGEEQELMPVEWMGTGDYHYDQNNSTRIEVRTLEKPIPFYNLFGIRIFMKRTLTSFGSGSNLGCIMRLWRQSAAIGEWTGREHDIKDFTVGNVDKKILMQDSWRSGFTLYTEIITSAFLSGRLPLARILVRCNGEDKFTGVGIDFFGTNNDFGKLRRISRMYNVLTYYSNENYIQDFPGIGVYGDVINELTFNTDDSEMNIVSIASKSIAYYEQGTASSAWFWNEIYSVGETATTQTQDRLKFFIKPIYKIAKL